MTVRGLQVLQTGVLLWAVVGLSSALVCPDGGMCEDRNTCCRNMEGGYGCCPLPHAECCSDHLHCCHQGTLCDLVHQKCVNKTVSLPWTPRVPSEPAPLAPQAVVCPDQESECPDHTTCCQLLDASWGCCPLAKAVCCQDKLHCCPEGTSCDLTHSQCVSSSLDSAPLLHTLPARRRDPRPAPPAGLVLCPGGTSSCPQGSACCLLPGGDSACCPFPQAACCSDRVHCCPSGTRCDLQRSTCEGIQPVTPTSGPLAAAIRPQVAPGTALAGRSVPCNDSVSCADGDTCCRSVEGEWACCPLPKAVCCNDGLHCCPHATVCNLAASTCDDPSGGGAAPRLIKSPAVPSATSRCDTSTSCPGKSTCCRTASGHWACCPLPQAVCCDDLVHCCPHGTVCNLEAQTCDDPSGSSPSAAMQSKMSAASVRRSQEEKCDRRAACPGGATCCPKQSGGWACCPLPQAVCCDDHEHCCPGGHRCNAARRTCDEPDGSGEAWLLKVPPLRPIGGDGSACDGRAGCPRDTTCCFMRGAQRWGCCPLPDAVCCIDGDHCCPSGHTCDPHRHSCSRGPRVIPWLSKLSPRTDPVAVDDVKCDDKSSCAAGATCCRLPSGEWGCCPLVKAVCCTDHEHCCPQGYTCNMESGTCEKTSSPPTQTAVVPDSPHHMGGLRCSTGQDLQ